jgi:hypothetical protein
MDSRLRPDPRKDLDPEASSTFTIVGVLVAAALVIGAILFFMRMGPTTTASNPTPVTTGQEPSRKSAPNVNPARPVPVPPAATDNPAKQGAPVTPKP